MRRSAMAVVVAVAMSWVAMTRADGGDPPSSPFAYAVFALGNLTLHDGARAVDGDVASNDATTIIGQGVLVAGSVVGRIIKARKGAQANSLFCLLLKGKSPLSCQAVTLPIVSTAQLPPVQVVPGTGKVKVPKGNSTSPIPAGAYGDVRVGSGGVLVLAGGTYVFKSIQLAPKGQLSCAAPCQIGVARTVKVKSNARLGGSNGTRPEQVRVNIGRTANNAVFTAGKQSTIAAVVYAPGGGIKLGQRGNFVGGFVGGTVNVSKGALVQARTS
jgi:hypothetical protein